MLLLLFACATSSQPAAVIPVDEAVAAEPTPVSPDCLDKADLADGTADHVVDRCPNCSFVMEGDATYTSTVDGYTVHSCSKACKLAFDKDPGKVLARACAHP